MTQTNQADIEGSPQYRHKKKLVEEQEALLKGKKNQTVIDEWWELVPKEGKKGGKVRHCKKMSDFTFKAPDGQEHVKPGNVYRMYIGKEKFCKEILDRAKKLDKLRTVY